MKPILLRLLLWVILTAIPIYAEPLNFYFETSQSTIRQGQTLRLDVKSRSPIQKGRIEWQNKNYILFPYPEKKQAFHHYFAYIGIDRDATLGTQNMVIMMPQAKNTFKKTISIVVEDGAFESGTVTLSDEKQKVKRDTESLGLELKKINTQFSNRSAFLKARSPFSLPVSANISSPFGAYRIYNGNAGRKHAGVDLAAAKGTIITAPQSGKVVLTEPFKVHGNTVMIDHGMGIVSIFNHMNSIKVKSGQWVKKGQPLGTVGETGVATGPHLHWGLSIQNIRVNPLDWIDNIFLFD